jgi:hypothetical protein
MIIKKKRRGNFKIIKKRITRNAKNKSKYMNESVIQAI